MSRCAHRLAGRVEYRSGFGRYWLDSVDVAGRPIRTCSNCGARLALGPSTDRSPDGSMCVEVEIAAVMLIDRTGGDGPRGARNERFTRHEQTGWSQHYFVEKYREKAGGWMWWPSWYASWQREEMAGWLAREMVVQGVTDEMDRQAYDRAMRSVIESRMRIG